jgi:hypothetical protein
MAAMPTDRRCLLPVVPAADASPPVGGISSHRSAVQHCVLRPRRAFGEVARRFDEALRDAEEISRVGDGGHLERGARSPANPQPEVRASAGPA